MGKERDLTRRKQLRKNRQHEKRKNALIVDYVQYKYANVYAEAFQLYQRLNDCHPQKTDLRKTEEYRVWKSEMSPQEPTNCESQASSPSKYQDSLQLKIPIRRYRTVKHSQTATTQTVSPASEESTQETPQTATTQTVSPASEESTQETPQTATTQTVSAASEESAQESPATVETAHVEVLQPTLVDELPPDLVDQIIGQLREDPDLKDIFDYMDGQDAFEDIDFETQELEIW